MQLPEPAAWHVHSFGVHAQGSIEAHLEDDHTEYVCNHNHRCDDEDVVPKLCFGVEELAVQDENKVEGDGRR